MHSMTNRRVTQKDVNRFKESCELEVNKHSNTKFKNLVNLLTRLKYALMNESVLHSLNFQYLQDWFQSLTLKLKSISELDFCLDSIALVDATEFLFLSSDIKINVILLVYIPQSSAAFSAIINASSNTPFVSQDIERLLKEESESRHEAQNLLEVSKFKKLWKEYKDDENFGFKVKEMESGSEFRIELKLNSNGKAIDYDSALELVHNCHSSIKKQNITTNTQLVKEATEKSHSVFPNTGAVDPQRVEAEKQNSAEVLKYEKRRKMEEIEALKHLIGLDKNTSISLRDIMKARKNNDGKCRSLKEMSFDVLESILMLNFNGREKHFKPLVTDDIDSWETSDDIDAETETVSPLDVLFTMFDSCNFQLKQELSEKLFTCKLAIPFIYYRTDGLPVVSCWTLRSIIATWRNRNQQAVEKPIVDTAICVVSVMRLGRPKFSKSKLVNAMLNEQLHHTFFNHDCFNGILNRTVSTGAVECAWYLPSNKDTDLFSEITMFLNVRGECRYNSKVTNYVSRISDKILLVVNVKDVSMCDKVLRDNVNISKLYLLLISDNSCKEKIQASIQKLKDVFGEDYKAHIIMGFTKSGEMKGFDNLKSEVKGRMQDPNRASSAVTLEALTNMGEAYLIKVDKGEPDIVEAKIKAEYLFQLIENEDYPKQNLMQLQLDPWKEWTKLQRERHETVQTENKKPVIKKKMSEVRTRQYTNLKHNNISANFFENILLVLNQYLATDPTKTANIAHYFIFWMKYLMNGRNRRCLPEIVEARNKIMDDLCAERRKQNALNDRMNNLEVELARTQEMYSCTSIGFDNLIREIAQRYECIMESTLSTTAEKERIQVLPEIAAKLLLNGYPLELMDGDVLNVPLTWIKSVFKEIHKLLGKKRLFVLSVLGLQSSGKSTLLNTMLGLKFPVSAGRCTKGLNMQLYPVEPASNYKFDFVLIVDTEGLRAPEFGSQMFNRDNELSTLSIGLGDVTIINVKGENINEIKDVLQISIHAFLKMKIVNEKLKLQQSCIFIHQNVGATDAQEKMEHGHKIFQDLLDKMTIEAAEQVNYADIRCFNDVITYDPATHIRYFSDLWLGDPPMAATNPGYSQKVSEVKDWLNVFANERQTFYSFDDLQMRIENLWRGIIAQDFIFSFQNCVHIKIYIDLETEMCRLILYLSEFTRERKKQLLVVFNSCEDSASLEQKCQEELTTARELMYIELKRVQSELEQYFDESTYKDIMINWREAKVRDLRCKAEQYLGNLKNYADNMKRPKLVELQQQENKNIHHKRIMKEAKELAQRLIPIYKNTKYAQKSTKASAEYLQKEFSKIWLSLSCDFISERPVGKIAMSTRLKDLLYQQRYIKDISASLTKEFEVNSGLLTSENLSKSLELHKLFNENDIRKRRSLRNVLPWGGNLQGMLNETFVITKGILDEAFNELAVIPSQDVPFDEEFAEKIFAIIPRRIHEFNTKKDTSFTMLESVTSKLLVLTLNYSSPIFAEMEQSYEKNMVRRPS